MNGRYSPEKRLLRGVSMRYADMFGKPHIGASYRTKSVHSNTLDEDAMCPICLRRATEVHHTPPLGMGSRNAGFKLHGKVLRPALIGVCRECHGGIHSGRYVLEWEWRCEAFKAMWWEGILPAEPHDEMLFEYGRWLVNGREL